MIREYGVTNLYGKTIQEGAQPIIRIAHSDFHEL
ncbi:MAG: hypothetical protein HN741_07175 [Anaerolineae bacterium]|nr:hypothetical protein [Anaerolineae bacterium]